MRRIESFTRNLCWIDVFDESGFGGKMHRLFGPRDVAQLIAGSMITGPAARVQLFASIAGKSVQIQIGPNRIVPDLQLVLHGAALHGAKIACGRHRGDTEATEKTASESTAVETPSETPCRSRRPTGKGRSTSASREAGSEEANCPTKPMRERLKRSS